MFIGGGTAGTAGGVKVTTLGVLLFMAWAELRGRSRVDIAHRSLGAATQRQAIAITVLSAVLVSVSTCVLVGLTSHGLDAVLFEVVSAFATVGLSTGITADFPMAGHLLLTVLMFAGRVGPSRTGPAAPAAARALGRFQGRRRRDRRAAHRRPARDRGAGRGIGRPVHPRPDGRGAGRGGGHTRGPRADPRPAPILLSGKYVFCPLK
ncbi:potassium transporter TrkG [Spongiactinospora sp. TRM90649]|uniref:potassium transporter TrkG n=1 Tax=Spongiactinospora sp. TRM90649 TaxID=3031114 RepID=UPI0023F817FA|nr:potassium transporter TrkG [Spongiactinospora sp. TRM90649]MDF5752184.1 potassium transporter TrkG [Spongiactinospora sp. TRM90649]